MLKLIFYKIITNEIIPSALKKIILKILNNLQKYY